MNWKVLLCVAALSVAAYDCFAGNDKVKSDVSSTLKELIDKNNLTGSYFVALVDSDGLSFFDTYSKGDRQLSKDTPILIASHTKALTGTLLAILHDAERIDLSKPISYYDPTLITSGKIDANKITVEQLLTHTSGFTSVPFTFKTAFLGYADQLELTRALNEHMLVAPDHQFRYSNTGPIVASMLAESVMGKHWAELISLYITKPLGMSATTANISGVTNILPAITTAKDGGVFDYGHHKTNATMHPAGGLVSTASDLAAWLKTNINQDASKLSKGDIFEKMHDKQVAQKRTYFTYARDGYTLGWDVAEYNGEALLTRFGNYGGYSIHVSFMPEREIGVIAFTNQDIAFTLPHVIANYAYNSVLEKSNRYELLEQESKRLAESIKAELMDAPDSDLIVQADELPSNLLGTYRNNKGWPEHKIYITNGQVKIDWGKLKGALLKDEQGYNAHFGVFSRKISIILGQNNRATLKNGSLIYKKPGASVQEPDVSGKV
ncbi:serine hydrolase domain-containing protein [uncultured Microbulbifer sp.]|uniref:serine hydrolase domain-containing protein n=1 Tax=uncultured Microbulbifer sp. TaxID=348147 RepID=UPI002602794F|nr:serine hydrolase domain-containing protein [uncultured Microbulbifer sp.]